MEGKRRGGPLGRVVALVAAGVVLAAALAPLPVLSHVGGSVGHLWKKHIRPKTDARYTTGVTELPANCPSSADVDTSFAKIGNLGTFEKASGGSKVQVTFDGRIRAATTTGNGVVFELRIDDAAAPGRARALLRAGEVGNEGVLASFSGWFMGLSKGTHTVSIWARSTQGTATGAMWDPGCFSTDKVVVEEFR